MNNWHNEFMAEYHRLGILEEAEQIRLERIALKSRVYRPGFYARTMYNFANWMILTVSSFASATRFQPSIAASRAQKVLPIGDPGFGNAYRRQPSA